MQRIISILSAKYLEKWSKSDFIDVNSGRDYYFVYRYCCLIFLSNFRERYQSANDDVPPVQTPLLIVLTWFSEVNSHQSFHPFIQSYIHPSIYPSIHPSIYSYMFYSFFSFSHTFLFNNSIALAIKNKRCFYNIFLFIFVHLVHFSKTLSLI